MILTLILLIAGFVLLIKGSDMFVDGSSSAARLMRIPPVIVGLTIVSMGTSAPEAAVSITAGIGGNNEIAFSNLIGSNIFNLLCVAGLSAAIAPFTVDKTIIKRDFPVCLGLMLITVLMSIDGAISRTDAVILLLIFFIYTGSLIIHAVKSRSGEKNDGKQLSALKSILFIIFGIAAIIIGGQLVVNSSVELAHNLGMSETLIGVTIIAIGTSLPELVTSVVAAKKGQSAIAIGNVIGSNIFNISFILGVSSMFHSISIVSEAFIDACIMLAVTVIGCVFCLKDKKLSRTHGIILIILYTAYTIYLIMR